MMAFFALLCLCHLPLMNSLTYIDNAITESNPKFMNVSFVYTHNERGSSISNVTFETKVTIIKMLVYVKVNIAEDQSALNYNRELMKTVIDVDKLFKGSHVHILVMGFTKSLSRFMDFKMKFPIKPVSFESLIKKSFFKLAFNRREYIDSST